MDQNSINRMNILFEKMVERRANTCEKTELETLYQTFFNEGRDSKNKPKSTPHLKWVVHS